MKATIRAGLASVAIAGSLLAATGQETPPYSGWLKVEVVSDSIWETCRLSLAVNESGKGSTETECRSEGVRTRHSKGALSLDEVAELRHLLRGADLFQGQFWGDDMRGIDGPLVTLVVNDGFKVAAMVCYKNKSFETGGRERLLTSLTKRLRLVPQGAK